MAIIPVAVKTNEYSGGWYLDYRLRVKSTIRPFSSLSTPVRKTLNRTLTSTEQMWWQPVAFHAAATQRTGWQAPRFGGGESGLVLSIASSAVREGDW
jgi:hypothetical protein